MKILGIHYGHDANAAIIEDGKVLFAISEERINRKKFYWGFPFQSIAWCLKHTDLAPQQIDHVALVNLNAQQDTLGNTLPNFYERLNRRVPQFASVLNLPLIIFDNLVQGNLRRSIARSMLFETLKDLGFPKHKVRFVDHHLAHAAGAFFLSGFRDSLVVTSDGKGDLVSHRTYLARDNYFEYLHESPDFNSIGLFYSCITEYLGFKVLRHEGKITGLAAYGDPKKTAHIPPPVSLSANGMSTQNNLIPEARFNDVYWGYRQFYEEDPQLFYKILTTKSAVLFEYARYATNQLFKKSFSGLEKEHVAAFAQKHLEDVLVKLVHQQVKRYNTNRVAMSGGTFGNVRLNQKIAELPEVDEVYIQPAMGDGGLGVGSAVWMYWDLSEKWEHEFLEQVYLGPEYSDDQIFKAIQAVGLPHLKLDDIEGEVGKALKNNKIVGRFHGQMEWGPRALGNRSILASPQDATINETLNHRLNRTEFMPFAPIILEDHAADYFVGYASEQLAPRFMTVTYEVAPPKRNLIPAVVHVDGTARPQVVRESENPSLHRILSAYLKQSGLPVLINTSFNMHEEPIVCTPQDAIRAYQAGAIDILAIGNYWVSDESLLPKS